MKLWGMKKWVCSTALVIGGLCFLQAPVSHAMQMDTTIGWQTPIMELLPDTQTASVGDVITDGNVKYEIVDTSAKTVKVVGYESGLTSTGLTLSSSGSLAGYKVVAIADEAFKNSSLQIIGIPATVTSFGANIFSGCDSLKTIQNTSTTPLILPTDIDGGRKWFGSTGGSIDTKSDGTITPLTTLSGDGLNFAEATIASGDYTIVYNFMDKGTATGSTTMIVTVPAYGFATPPEVPEREGYNFVSWHTYSDTAGMSDGNIWDFETETRPEDYKSTSLNNISNVTINLYAKWVEKPVGVEEVTAGSSWSVRLEKYTAKWYQFIPEETGTYTLTNSDKSTYCCMYLYETYGDTTYQKETLLSLTSQLEAGKPYYFKLYNSNTSAKTFNMTLTKEGQSVVEKTNISTAAIGTIANQFWTGSAITPAVTVTLNGTTLVKDTDYTVSYSNNINVGTATVTVTGKGNYTGTKTATFNITKKSISAATIGTIANQSWTGSAITPAVTVTLSGTTLVKDTDYTVSYSDNTNVGTATVTVTGTGSYTGTKTATFNITKAISKCTINTNNESFTYDGSSKQYSNLIVSDGSTILTAGTHYTLAYSNNINAGESTAKVTITGKGNYIGTKDVYFTINQADWPGNTPPDSMTTVYETSTVSQVSLASYTGWSWNDGSISLSSGSATATAVYGASDKDNYKNISKQITITRKACTHPSLETKNAKAATCEEKGYTGDQCCAQCGEVRVQGSEINALGHDWDNGVVTKEATYTSTGIKTFTCQRTGCGKTKTEVIDKLPQEEKPPVVPEASMEVEYSVQKVSDISLAAYANWNWDSEDANQSLNVGQQVTATAVYNGSDAAKYKITQVEITIIRKGCTHPEANRETRNAVTATCEKAGYSGDIYCTSCNECVTNGHDIPATGHKWNNGVVTTPSTDTTNGVMTYTCTACSKTKTEVIYANSAPNMPPTRMSVAYGIQKISDIDLSQYPNWQWQDAYKETSLEVAKETTAVAEYTGGGSYSVKTVTVTITRNACDHVGCGTDVKDAVTATCETSGFSGNTYCTTCGTITLWGSWEAPLGHDWDDGTVTTLPTYTTTGVKTYYCNRDNCEGTKTEIIPVLEKADYPAGKPDARMEIPFSVNGTAMDAVSKITLAENWKWADGDRDKQIGVNVEVTATAEYTGTDKDEYQYNSVVVTIKRLACTHVGCEMELQGAVPATCTGTGYTGNKICKTCGNLVEQGTQITPLGHDWDEGEVVVPPTDDENGISIYRCKREGCDATEERTVSKKDVCEHTGYETIVRDKKAATCETAGYTGDTYCSFCEKKIASGETIPATGHKWNAGVVTTEPTYTTAGVKTYTCSVCPKTRTETIAALGAPASGTILPDTKTAAQYKVAAAGTEVTYTASTNKNAKKVTIPDTVTIDGITYKVTTVAANAFKNNKKMTTVVIGKNIKKIDKNAFNSCKKLKTVKMGSSVTTIADRAFYKCTAMTDITIPDKVTNIGKEAFYGCTKLKKITIKTKSLKSSTVGKNAFKKGYSKPAVKVPKSKLKDYKTLLKKKGMSAKAVIKK